MSSVLSKLASNRQNVALTEWTQNHLIPFTWNGADVEEIANTHRAVFLS